ncbi:MAG: SdrD B-like domain-containing protein, partial [Coriobacteriia bacterium]
VLNEFEYNGDLSGHKFNDIDGSGIWDEDEPGIEGWGIYLFRAVPELLPVAIPDALPGYALYASTVTGADGSYSFGGVLPGTYYVAEEDREGWTMTVGPEGTFELVGDQPIADLDFGNTEDFLPFTDIDLAITKVADVESVEPGDVVTYTLTYRNLGETEAMDFTIEDDFDERYMTVVDSAGGTVAGGTITWTLAGPLGMDDGPQTIVYTMKVIDELPEGVASIDNVVAIDHPDDNDPRNDTDDETVSVEPFLPFTPDDDPFLPFTGGEALLLVLAAVISLGLGLTLRRAAAVR